MDDSARTPQDSNRVQIDAASTFRDNRRLTIFCAIGATIGMAVYWITESPIDDIARTAGYLLGAFVSAVLGFRAHQKSHSVASATTAIGVAWRVALLWLVLSALAENLTTGDAVKAVLNFPSELLVSTCVGALVFMVGNLASVGLRGIRRMEPREVLQLVLVVAGVLMPIALQYFGSQPGVSSKGEGSLEEQGQQKDLNQLREEVEEIAPYREEIDEELMRLRRELNELRNETQDPRPEVEQESDPDYL